MLHQEHYETAETNLKLSKYLGTFPITKKKKISCNSTVLWGDVEAMKDPAVEVDTKMDNSPWGLLAEGEVSNLLHCMNRGIDCRTREWLCGVSQTASR